MIAFLVSEVAFFSTLIVVYLTFLGKDTVGPSPREALSLPLVIATTICLLSSSYTIHRAEGSARGLAISRRVPEVVGGHDRAWGRCSCSGTGYEWFDLIITRIGLTIDPGTCSGPRFTR